jgi:hypothetical protein
LFFALRQIDEALALIAFMLGIIAVLSLISTRPGVYPKLHKIVT